MNVFYVHGIHVQCIHVHVVGVLLPWEQPLQSEVSVSVITYSHLLTSREGVPEASCLPFISYSLTSPVALLCWWLLGSMQHAHSPSVLRAVISFLPSLAIFLSCCVLFSFVFAHVG